MDTEQATVPYGYCHCGCGEATKPWERSNRPRGRVKGEPRQYIHGHHARKSGPQYVIDDRGYGTPCWIWQLAITRDGHGDITIDGRKMRAHVVFYERQFGPVPDAMHLHHRCEQPACVNPDHLEPLTPAAHRQAHSRLDWDDVREIRRRVANGERRRVVANDFGLSLSGIDHIIQGNRWRVPEVS